MIREDDGILKRFVWEIRLLSFTVILGEQYEENMILLK
jgi:hypothetical protein